MTALRSMLRNAGQERDEEDPRIQGTTRWILHVINLAPQTTRVSGAIESPRPRTERTVAGLGRKEDWSSRVVSPGRGPRLGVMSDPLHNLSEVARLFAPDHGEA
jgi:hypothetical protein